MNERDIINMISGVTAGEAEALVLGIGDDCAVVKKDTDTVWLITMDTLVESVHFDRSWHSAYKLGRKSISVNVSDIAAMGGKPLFVLLSAGLPKGFDPSWFKAFSEGVAAACTEYGCLVIGGDTVRCPEGYSFTVTVIGETLKQDVIYRHSAQPGDDIWVSGPLGHAAAGLSLFLEDRHGEDDKRLLEAHLDPKARVEYGHLLAREKLVHAMMDLSDGLATDLAHLCLRSGVKAQVIEQDIPVSDELQLAAAKLAKSPVDLALRGGEDFELLFTASPEHRDSIIAAAKQCGLTPFLIGIIAEGEGVTLLSAEPGGKVTEQAVSYGGYDHFPED